ncbi:MAG: family 43 glycosylhydrolase [Clostridia bacterium]|nr:family 43 glycosylhydrolase [Clostridia bacterium]
MRIIHNKGVCDPHVHIFNGKAYMFTTHDRGPGQPIFRMDDWRVFSSDDLLNWKLEYTLRPEDTFLGKCEECYATDAAERNGRYYMYFSHQQYCIGVAVSENGPGGPYRDALGKPLIPKGMVDTACYDPTVFIDDDEARTPYIMFGFTCIGKKYYVARLNEDMISLAEPPRPVELEPNWDSDACWITKRGGTYYLTTHEARFATSKSIYGPYTYHGKFMYDYTVDHGTFFTYHNQTYFTYGVPENLGDEKIDPYYRTTKIVYAHFKDDGAIVTDDFIKIAGVGQYDAGWDVIKGEWYFAASDGIYKKENEDGFEIRGIGNGSYLYYQNVNSMRQNAPVELRLSNGNKEACTVEIRENSPFGAVLGSFRAGYTGGFDKFETFRLELDNAYGTHNLCFVFYSEAEEAVRFEDFRFTKIRP